MNGSISNSHSICRAKRPICAAIACFLVMVRYGSIAAAFGPPSSVDVLEGRLGHEITAETLIEILKSSEDSDLRNLAVSAACEFGPDAKELVPFLISAFERGNGISRCNIACALSGIGPPAIAAIPSLIRALQDDDEMVSSNAAGALGRCGAPAKAAVPSLAAMVSRRERDEGFGYFTPLAAAAAIGKFGSNARSVVPELVAVLAQTDRSPYIRRAVATALGEIAAPGDRIVLAALSRVAKLESGTIRVGKEGATEAEEEASVRIAAALAIWKKSHRRQVVAWLAEPLTHKENVFYLREHAAMALGEIGPDAEAAMPMLISLVTDWKDGKDDCRCSSAAVVALGKIRSREEASVRVLEEQVVRNSGLSELAIEALAEIGDPARKSLRALVGALEHESYEVRLAAADAIRRIGGDTDPTVAVLTECLAVTNVHNFFRKFPGVLQGARIRARAAKLLGHLGRRAEDAIPDLEAALDDKFITVRKAAAEALREIKRDGLK